MGSTFKTFTTAMVLDAGKANLKTLYDARRPLTYGKFQIKDFHAQNRVLSAAEVFEHSSNIGSARMALSVGIEGHKDFLRKLGLLEPLPFEIAETSRPIVPKHWGAADGHDFLRPRHCRQFNPGGGGDGGDGQWRDVVSTDLIENQAWRNAQGRAGDLARNV
jgi:cell division protein FtsI/penicillin-binding protein 2